MKKIVFVCLMICLSNVAYAGLLDSVVSQVQQAANSVGATSQNGSQNDIPKGLTGLVTYSGNARCKDVSVANPQAYILCSKTNHYWYQGQRISQQDLINMGVLQPVQPTNVNQPNQPAVVQQVVPVQVA